MTLENAADAIEEVYYQFNRLTSANDVLTQASALMDLNNAISDLVSWHPGYDINSGTLPYEREEQE